MQEITTYDYASSVVGKCNANFGEEYQAVSANNDASTFIGYLNDNFGNIDGIQQLSVNDYANTIISKLNANFELFESSSGDVPQPYGLFKFLHVSDTHGSQYAITKSKKMMGDSTDVDYDEDINFLIHSGDIFSDKQTYTQMPDALEDFSDGGDYDGRFLAVAGNHDIAQTFSGKPTEFRTGTFEEGQVTPMFAGMDKYMENSGVVWGGNEVSYWYKDINNVDNIGGKLRIIGLNDFQGSSSTSNNIAPKATQEQCEWLGNTLKALGKKDYFIIVTHFPPFRNDHTSYDYWSTYPAQDTLYNLFLSDRQQSSSLNANGWVKGYGSIFQRIVDAYIQGKSRLFRANGNSENWASSYTYNNQTIVNLDNEAFDFGGRDRAKFLFFMNGHIHADVTYYLIDFNNLLNINIECSKANDGQKWASDFNKYYTQTVNQDNMINGHWMAINKITLNFATKQTTIERIGAKYTENDGILGSRERNVITFPFTKPTT